MTAQSSQFYNTWMEWMDNKNNASGAKLLQRLFFISAVNNRKNLLRQFPHINNTTGTVSYFILFFVFFLLFIKGNS